MPSPLCANDDETPAPCEFRLGRSRCSPLRPRRLLVSAFAVALLTMLGAVGESLGMDRPLKSNTSKTRTHSLFRQGCMLCELIPNRPGHRLLPLMEAFARAVSNALELSGVFAQKQ